MARKVLVLKRFCYTPECTIGILNGIINAKNHFSISHLCMTVEPGWRDNIPYESCIPNGIYRCEITSSTKSVYKETLSVTGVPNRTFIQFHVGNTSFESEGCILPVRRAVIWPEWTFEGTKYQNVLGGAASRAAYKNLMTWLGKDREAQIRITDIGNDVSLNINALNKKIQPN